MECYDSFTVLYEPFNTALTHGGFVCALLENSNHKEEIPRTRQMFNLRLIGHLKSWLCTAFFLPFNNFWFCIIFVLDTTIVFILALHCTMLLLSFETGSSDSQDRYAGRQQICFCSVPWLKCYLLSTFQWMLSLGQLQSSRGTISQMSQPDQHCWEMAEKTLGRELALSPTNGQRQKRLGVPALWGAEPTYMSS